MVAGVYVVLWKSGKVGVDWCIRHLWLILYTNINFLVVLCALYLHSTDFFVILRKNPRWTHWSRSLFCVSSAWEDRMVIILILALDSLLSLFRLADCVHVWFPSVAVAARTRLSRSPHLEGYPPREASQSIRSAPRAQHRGDRSLKPPPVEPQTLWYARLN